VGCAGGGQRFAGPIGMAAKVVAMAIGKPGKAKANEIAAPDDSVYLSELFVDRSCASSN